MLTVILKQNFLLYSTVPISLSCDEYPPSSSAPQKLCRSKRRKKQKFLRVAIATVTHKAMKFGTWIALDQLYILCRNTIALSLIALVLGPKMSFFVHFGPKIGHFRPVTIATSRPISFSLVIYLCGDGGYMISAFNEPQGPIWPCRTSKTSIFGENHRHPQLPGPISRKRLELGQI